MHARSHEIFQEIKSAWMDLENIAEKAAKSFGRDDPIAANLGYACIYMMYADQEIKGNPNKTINYNMLEDTTLDQILDVLNLIKGEAPESRYDLIDTSNRAFITSTRFYGVHRNTIADACTRRLQLNIGEFRELVRKWLNGDPSGLKSILKSHTPEHYHSEINAFFSAERRLP